MAISLTTPDITQIANAATVSITGAASSATTAAAAATSAATAANSAGGTLSTAATTLDAIDDSGANGTVQAGIAQAVTDMNTGAQALLDATTAATAAATALTLVVTRLTAIQTTIAAAVSYLRTHDCSAVPGVKQIAADLETISTHA